MVVSYSIITMLYFVITFLYILITMLHVVVFNVCTLYACCQDTSCIFNSTYLFQMHVRKMIIPTVVVNRQLYACIFSVRFFQKLTSML